MEKWQIKCIALPGKNFEAGKKKKELIPMFFLTEFLFLLQFFPLLSVMSCSLCISSLSKTALKMLSTSNWSYTFFIQLMLNQSQCMTSLERITFCSLSINTKREALKIDLKSSNKEW